MSNQARLAERLIGLFAFFVENGTTVDSQTVSATVVPDASPTSNWLSLGTVLPGASFGLEEDDDSYLAPSAAGGFEKVERMNVMQDILTLQTREMTGIVDRLQMGLASAIVEGTPQSPHVTKDRKVTGWLLLQARQVGGNGSGTDDFRLLWWCDIRLGEQPQYENKVISPNLKIIKRANTLNSINFPAAV
jgi:hypothetical protein